MITFTLEDDEARELYEQGARQMHSGITARFFAMLGERLRSPGRVASNPDAKQKKCCEFVAGPQRCCLMVDWNQRWCRFHDGVMAGRAELGPVSDMTDDEKAITKGFIAKLMGEGRTEHGPLNLAADERDLLGEAADELNDSIAYLLMEQRRLLVRRSVA